MNPFILFLKFNYLDFCFISFFFNLISLFLYFLFFIFSYLTQKNISYFLCLLARGFLILGIIVNGVTFFSLPLSSSIFKGSFFELYNFYETLVLLIFLFSITAFFISLFLVKKDLFLFLSLIFILSLSILALAYQKSSFQLPSPSLLKKSILLIPHIYSYFLSYVFAFLSLIIILFSKILFLFFSVDYKNYFYLWHGLIKLSFIFFNSGLFLGMIWSDQIWGTFWIWDPKENWSLFSFCFYLIYFHLLLLQVHHSYLYFCIFMICFSMLFTYLGLAYLPKEILNFSRHNYIEIGSFFLLTFRLKYDLRN